MVAVNELGLLGVIEHGLEKGFTLLLTHPLDMSRHQPIDIDGLAARLVMGAECGMQ